MKNVKTSLSKSTSTTRGFIRYSVTIDLFTQYFRNQVTRVHLKNGC